MARFWGVVLKIKPQGKPAMLGNALDRTGACWVWFFLREPRETHDFEGETPWTGRKRTKTAALVQVFGILGVTKPVKSGCGGASQIQDSLKIQWFALGFPFDYPSKVHKILFEKLVDFSFVFY